MNETVFAVLALVFGGVAYAHPGHGGHMWMGHMPPRPLEWRENMTQTIEDGDYDAWKDMMEESGRGKITEKITEQLRRVWGDIRPHKRGEGEGGGPRNRAAGILQEPLVAGFFLLFFFWASPIRP